jgi:hypothetical protein
MKKLVIVVILSLFIVSTLFAASARIQNRDKDCSEYCPVCGSPGIPLGEYPFPKVPLWKNFCASPLMKIELFVCQHGHKWECLKCDENYKD